MTKKSKRYKDGWHPFKKGADAKKSSERPPIPDGLNAEEFWDRCQDDRRYYFEHCLRIRVKIDGKNLMVPLMLNREQSMILDSIEEQEKLGVPIRIIILKSRKVGSGSGFTGLQ